jgi:hypothetical protein
MFPLAGGLFRHPSSSTTDTENICQKTKGPSQNKKGYDYKGATLTDNHNNQIKKKEKLIASSLSVAQTKKNPPAERGETKNKNLVFFLFDLDNNM